MKEYRKQIFIALFAYIGQIMFGYAAGWTTPLMSKFLDPEQFPNAPDTVQLNWMVSTIFLGSFMGSVISVPLTNVLGRKHCMIMGGLTGCLSFLALALIKDPNVMIPVRLIQGFGISTVFGVNLVYIGEIASTEIRGILLGCTGLFNSFGFLLVFSVGAYVSYEVVNYIGLILGALYVCGIVFAPETPVFHIIKGRNEEARATLLALGRKEDAENIHQFKIELEESKKSKPWKTLFRERSNRKALVITSVLHIFQQASGIGAMMAYTTFIFEISGSSVTPFIATIIVGAVNLTSGFITPLFVERFGRKFLLLLSTFLTGLALLILAVHIYYYNIGHPAAFYFSWLPLPVFMLYCISYSFGFGVIPSTILGEMFQLNVRSAGSTITLGLCWICGYISISTFGFIIDRSGIHVAFLMFSAACGLAFIFTIFFVPETKGKSLIELQKMLDK